MLKIFFYIRVLRVGEAAESGEHADPAEEADAGVDDDDDEAVAEEGCR